LKFINAVFAIFWKDFLGERRTHEILAAMLVFTLIVILIFVFAFNLSVETRRSAATGVIWVTLCFADRAMKYTKCSMTPMLFQTQSQECKAWNR